MNNYKNVFIPLLLLTLFSQKSAAEDIELYVGNEVQRAATNPQVLIIFDNSGSMKTEEPYEADFTGVSALNPDDWIYYSHDPSNSMPTTSETKRRFRASKLGCYFAIDILKQQGTYSGKLRKYKKKNGTKQNQWAQLNDDGYNNENAIGTVDCLVDLEQGININASGFSNGYPSKKGNEPDFTPYTADINDADLARFETGKAYTLFTKEYLQFIEDDNTELSRSRIEIAKETVIRLVETSPGVDYGLMVFNSSKGGRVVYDIADMSEGTNQTDYINKIKSLEAKTWTPLCETLYEAMRYYGGKSVDYGDDGGSLTPAGVYTSGSYPTPFANCSNDIYTIMITDGAPTNDDDRNQWYIDNLTGLDTSKKMWMDINDDHKHWSYLPALSHWMKNHDINPDIQGDQHSTLYTIGFGKDAISDAGLLLKSAAENGGGEYYPAANASQLLASLQSALLEILQLDTSFTAPSIASNNYDRTETLDSIYYAMFLPEKGSKWRGNLKKLKLLNDQQVDKDGKAAIDVTGNISTNAKTYWSDNGGKSDGNDVKQGGVSEVLQKVSTRKIYSDLGTNNALVDFTTENAIAEYANAEELSSLLGLGTDTNAIGPMLNWAKGLDVDDEDEDDVFDESRESIFGDPLHFKPFVINYGGSAEDQDIRIVVGTNSGALHMFKDEGDDVSESWAFMPKEFFEQYPLLRDSNEEITKNYSVDGLATAYKFDSKGDGKIDAEAGDKAWLFFGLRRGGSSYYAIDVSDPDAPKYMWKISANDSTYAHLGSSWSKMKIGYSKAHKKNGKPAPVLFFSAGYDDKKDSAVVGTKDDVGLGLYMVDAETGSLIWSLTPGDKSATNTHFSGFNDSITASPSLLDSDSDGMVDRVYLPDTGGNIWRIDMPFADPFDTVNPWTIFKFASIAGDTQLTDRRFMSEAAIARTYMQVTETTQVNDGNGNVTSDVIRYKKPFEAILLGSGDRSNPQATDNQDRLYVFKDENILTRSFVGTDIPTTITSDKLYSYTDNPYGEDFATDSAKDTLDLAVSAMNGWYINLGTNGEKSLAAPSVIAGVAYFTSFTPSVEVDGDSCELSTGLGKLYAVNLEYGTNVYEWRTLEIGDRVPDTPTFMTSPSEDGPSKIITTIPPGDGKTTLPLCTGDGCDEDNPGISLETLRTYLYLEEQN